jgi:hypothetical protein
VLRHVTVLSRRELTKVGTLDNGFQEGLEQRVAVCLQIVTAVETSLTAVSNGDVSET